jgi:hypothetical protein
MYVYSDGERERERGGGIEAVFCAFHMDSTLLHYDS